MMKRLTKLRLSAAILLCGGTIFGAGALALPAYTEWRQPLNAEAMPLSTTLLNTTAIDGCVSISRDGLSLFFNSNRGGNQDIYMATRRSRDEGFDSPERLPAPINTSANEACPTYTQGHDLYFSSDREDPAYDLYVARFQSDDWTAPESLGPTINRRGWLEETPTFFEDDDGRSVMIYSSRLPNGTAGKLYESIDGGVPTLLPGPVASAASDNRPSITHDGLTLFFDSTRAGGLGSIDLYVATRDSTSEPFRPAVNLRALNSPAFDARPTISWDAAELFFSSSRAGSESALPDIWWTSREKRGGPKMIEPE